jgi:putative hydrolase of the HAD superfamily
MSEAIIFDLFETLITEYIPDYRPSVSLAHRLGMDDSAFARAWADLRAARYLGELADYPSALRAACARCGVQPAEELLDQLHQERLAQKALPFAEIDPSILAMLAVLRQRPVKLGLISNATLEEVAGWATSPLAPFFEELVFSYQVGLAKPDPRIYHLACARLGVRPAHALFVGDGGSDELTGAAKAGLTPLWATWFLDRWPPEKRLRASLAACAQFPRLRTPDRLLHAGWG